MKLVILTRDLEYGGAQRQLVALSRGLRRRGHDVGVAVLYANGPLEQDLHAAGVAVKVFNKQGRWDLWPVLFDLARFVRQEQPQVLHGYIANELVAFLKPLCRGKVVWGVRGSKEESERSDWLVHSLNWFGPMLSRLPDLIICNSHAGFADAAAHGYPEHKMAVIPNGIDTERFCPNPVARQEARVRFEVGEHEQLVGLVGRLDPMKDYPTFLRAAAMAARQGAQVRFICVGTGPDEYARRLRELACELGLSQRLIWAGPRSDMPAIYNALDVAVLASAYGEGFPNVVGEAMATGVPCVVTDVGDSASIVADLGEVVPPRNPVALSHAIGRLLDGSGKGCDRDAIRGHIVANYSVPRLLDRTERLLLAQIGGVTPC